MIAVHAAEPERGVVAEFFELFKTPWEFFHEGSVAEVLICSRGEVPLNKARLVLIYGGSPNFFDRENCLAPHVLNLNNLLSCGGNELPIYAGCVGFASAAGSNLKHESSGDKVMVELNLNGRQIVRIGYDLFKEVRHLLTIGQPAVNAGVPALEIHIALMRDLIVKAAIPLVEIPPMPAGAGFIACLTHDVDHVGIRNHKCDHTMFGFLYRATIGSFLGVVRGRKTVSQLATNCLAVLKLPFVHLGLARDFWYQFEHYIEIENGAASTFFVIPNKGETGLDAEGNRPAKRAASYDVADITQHLSQLQAAGKEVGVHGIDAWRDAEAGAAEQEIISQVANAAALGVRMHWLYFNDQSPAQLERAGFRYDSTVGYNETVGYRAGTTQVYKPLSTAHLLELPMHVMDTALFYPGYLNLSSTAARERIRPLIANAVRFGGMLTVNWHDRSLAPERLWDGSYRQLLADCRERGAWFASAVETVEWFRKRRSVKFTPGANGRTTIRSASEPQNLPRLRVRHYSSDTKAGGFVEQDMPDGGEIVLAA